MAEERSKSQKRKWKAVVLDDPSFFSGDLEGFGSLEVLEEYDLEKWKGGVNSGPTKKKRAKKVCDENQSSELLVTNSQPRLGDKMEKSAKKKKRRKKKAVNIETSDDKDATSASIEKSEDSEELNSQMVAWQGLGVPEVIQRSLKDQGFTSPTPIQTLSLPPGIFHHRDIIGAAETGSGKTLAFGIPVLTHILNRTSNHENEVEEEASSTAVEENTLSSHKTKKPLLALIMTPTRELALQIRNHLKQAARHTSIEIVAVVGGMAPQKQQRLLQKQPEIIVATPGRLWDLISEGEKHVCELHHLRFLVIDEADRMVEQGHFQELSSILDLIHRTSDSDNQEEGQPKKTTKKALQKFIFSATLTLPKSFRKSGREKTITKGDVLVSLMDKVGLKKNSCKVIDMTNKRGTVETLTETKISCSLEEKDLHLYYFVSRYPGRTLVFSNTVDCVRRLGSLFRLLNFDPWVLHASMQQRQRLKNLDRFKSSTSGLLLATDVAARGLDIPAVEHVIHYQVPKDPDLYIHRSGRTARASREGLSVVLVGPEEFGSYKKIMKTLNSGNDLDSFPVDVAFMSSIRKRISLAKQIDKEEHKFRRKKSNNDWVLASAKAMDIEVDEDLLEDLGDSQEIKKRQGKLKQMKAELSSLLKTPLIPSGFSGKYPTKSGSLVLPGINSDTRCEDDKKVAIEDAKTKKRRKKEKT
ncbi:ATP-dependent RNA helicase DDX24-like [Montipora foliosa]|uniref:ATP-dependent RNA helicase DDX24-like n=1 Tax=Montipora foliosa TaxID=591990 RepID=UPI0035F1CE9D